MSTATVTRSGEHHPGTHALPRQLRPPRRHADGLLHGARAPGAEEGGRPRGPVE